MNLAPPVGHFLEMHGSTSHDQVRRDLAMKNVVCVVKRRNKIEEQFSLSFSSL